mmetsp:Transcript_50381/g.156172  ORF Transcript_50381/g.156172 Transcript_50381/m.156172 type:complete len:345 (+) Transcript_50381:54-1088(+)
MSQGKIQICDEVLRRLEPDRKPDHVVAGPGGRPLLVGQLPVRSRGRVQDQGAGVADVGEVAEQLHLLDDPHARLVAALDSKGEHCPAGSTAQILLGQGGILGACQSRVGDPSNLGVGFQETSHLEAVGDVAVDPNGQRLAPLDGEERVQGRHRRADVAEAHRMRKHCESHVAKCLAKGHPVVCRLWLRHRWKLLRNLGPVKLARINDHASQRAALPRKKLRGAVHDEVCTELNRPAEVGGREGVVDDEGDLRRVGDLRERADVADHAAGVRQALGEEEADRGVLDGLPHLLQVVHVDEGAVPLELLDGLAELRDAPPVELVGGHDAIAWLHEAEQRDELRCVAR